MDDESLWRRVLLAGPERSEDVPGRPQLDRHAEDQGQLSRQGTDDGAAEGLCGGEPVAARMHCHQHSLALTNSIVKHQTFKSIILLCGLYRVSVYYE